VPANFAKIIARVFLYGALVVAVVLLALHYTGSPQNHSLGAVGRGHDTSEFGPVKVTPRPLPTHPPFVAPTPYVRPLKTLSIAQLKLLAKTGNADARCELGMRYYDGKGRSKNWKAAYDLFSTTANQSNACGLNNLGRVAQDAGNYQEASILYRKAAALGWPAAFYNLGMIAKWGPEPNEIEAFEWFKQAALRGFTPAYDLVATGILAGYGGATYADPWLAEQWYLLGAKAGEQHAKEDLAWYYMYTSREPGHYQKAMYWWRKAACRCGDYQIGKLYALGLGVRKDIAEAARWYKRSADAGYANAQAAYGDLLRRGLLGAAPNPKAALPYYEKAADQGNGDAMYAIADMLERGIVLPRDRGRAEVIYAAAAAHCSGPALFRLAQIRWVGSAHTPKDPNRSMALAIISVDCGMDFPTVKKWIATHFVTDVSQSNAYYAQYRAAIHDYTGNPNFAPRNQLPPVDNSRSTAI